MCLFGCLFCLVLLHQRESDGRCNKQRRHRTEHNTQNHSEGEAADGVTTEDEDTQQHNQGTNRGVDGTRQCGVQRVIEQLHLVALRIETEELAHTVEDNHLIVDGVTDSCQDGTE